MDKNLQRIKEQIENVIASADRNIADPEIRSLVILALNTAIELTKPPSEDPGYDEETAG